MARGVADAEKTGTDFAAKVGCADPACLREKSADAILEAWPPFPAGAGAPYGTKLLPIAPMKAFADGDFARVPVLVGFARNEMFARHGFKFHDKDLIDHFAMQPWYHPIATDVSLTPAELKNLDGLHAAETRKGC